LALGWQTGKGQVIWKSDGVKGFPLFRSTELDEDATVELISLWVAPSGRGFGVGDALVEAVIKWASEQNASSVSLDVTEGNQQATKLYLRNGFVDIGKLVLHNPEEKPERRFLKSLSLS
jgi:ribosomal protein S18 acetylase RimI-like enzyme